MVSIRKRLLVLIFSVFTCFSVIVSLMVYLGAKDEVADIYDENMKQVALAISGSISSVDNVEEFLPQFQSAKRYFGRHRNFLHRIIDDEEEFLIQIWKDKKLKYSSHGLINLPLKHKLGYSNVFYRRIEWRIYKWSKNGIDYQIAQPEYARNEIALEIAQQFFIPLIFITPLMFFILYFSLGKGLQPLTSISKTVKSRNEHNFSLIEYSQAPEEILPLIEALNDLLIRLQKAFKKQRNFVADAAHELRTPLTAVQLQLDVLERAETHVEKNTAQKNLKAGIARSIHLVKSLLMLARNESESLSEHNDDVDLKDVLGDVMNSVSALAREKNITVSQNIGVEDIVVKGQKEAFVTMVENLVQNAILYSDADGEIRIDLNSDNGKVVFKISDSGIGIKPESRERIFDRFYRELGTKRDGSGLGLSIVKNIVDYYKGTITVGDGINGKGCSFTVCFTK